MQNHWCQAESSMTSLKKLSVFQTSTVPASQRKQSLEKRKYLLPGCSAERQAAQNAHSHAYLHINTELPTCFSVEIDSCFDAWECGGDGCEAGAFGFRATQPMGPVGVRSTLISTCSTTSPPFPLSHSQLPLFPSSLPQLQCWSAGTGEPDTWPGETRTLSRLNCTDC